MISYAEALQIIEREGAKLHRNLRTECLPLLESIGRYSANDIHSLDNNPRFDNSAMDGFAVVALKTRGASAASPLRLTVEGCLAAGDARIPGTCVADNEPNCLEITTGAKLPESSYDAVVRLEDVEREQDGSGRLVSILLRAPVEPCENIRRAGEDIRIGERLFPRCTQIGPQHLLALSMTGYPALDVLRRPKVVIFSTGNELVPSDSPEISAQQIRNSTAPLLCSSLESYGAEVHFHGIVRDNTDEIRKALFQALEVRPDIIISTGGVSVGRFDLVASVLREVGARVYFHRVAVRPGKPILFGEFASSGPVFFGLPGNPIAVATGIRFFVRPYLRALLGAGPETVERLPLTQEVQKPEGLSFFQRAVREGQGVRVLKGQASFMVKSLLGAEGWVVGAPEPELLRTGELVDWYTLW